MLLVEQMRAKKQPKDELTTCKKNAIGNRERGR